MYKAKDVDQNPHTSSERLPLLMKTEAEGKGMTAVFPCAVSRTYGPSPRLQRGQGLWEVAVRGPQRGEETESREPWQEFVTNCLSYFHGRKTDRKSVNKTLLHPPRASALLLSMHKGNQMWRVSIHHIKVQSFICFFLQWENYILFPFYNDFKKKMLPSSSLTGGTSDKQTWTGLMG